MEKSSTEKDIEEIRTKIKANAAKIKEAKAQETARTPIPFLNLEFPVKNFIDFKVYSEESKAELSLTTYFYPPEEKSFPTPLGVLYLFHGLTGTQTTQSHIAGFFAKKGFVCVGFDLRSNGDSGGKSFESFQTIVQDGQTFISLVDQFLAKKYEKGTAEMLKARFTWGISLGGLVSFELSRLAPEKFRGVMLVCPAFGFLGEVEKFALQSMSGLNPYGVLKASENKLSRNPEVWERKDEMKGAVYKNCSILIEQTKAARTFWKDFECPFVEVIPGMDKLVPPEIQFEFFETATSKDKTVFYYEDNWHGITLEKEIDEVNERLWEWVKMRID